MSYHIQPISIITPTYNHELYIGKCIESVLAQTFKDWEMIIIDDGSTDRTAEIIARYEDPRIIYVHQEHQGPSALSATYNKALSIAKSELITILEGDDFWPPYKLQSQIECFNDPDVILSFGRVVTVNSRGKPIREHSRYRNFPLSVLNNDPVTSATPYILRGDIRTFPPPSTVVIRRSALEGIGGFKSTVGLPMIDRPTFLHLSLVGRFCYVDKVLGFWRRHFSSVTHSYGKMDRVINIKKFVLDFYTQNREHLVTKQDLYQQISLSWDVAYFSNVISDGQIALYHKRWKQAYKLFRQTLRAPSIMRKLIALVGMACACTQSGIIIEVLFKLALGYTVADLIADDVRRE